VLYFAFREGEDCYRSEGVYGDLWLQKAVELMLYEAGAEDEEIGNLPAYLSNIQLGGNLAADVNGDGKVDIFDLVLVGSHFGEKAAPSIHNIITSADLRHTKKSAKS